MSYPQQQPRGYGGGMPMPQQYPVQNAGSPYPNYGQQQQHRPPYPQPAGQVHPTYPPQQPARPPQSTYPPQRPPQQQPYQSNIPPPYPASSTQAAPYPTSTTQTNSQAPYPTSRVQNMSINRSSSEVDQWLDNSTKSIAALIKDASKSELEQLLNNEDKLIELVQDTNGVKSLQKKCQALISENKDQAVTNLTLEPEIEHLREQLLQLAQEQNELKEKYSQLQQQIGGKISLDGMLAVLQAEASQSESESENISSEFMESDYGGENIELFIETFMAKRIEYQLRKVKAEKMTTLMTQTTTTNMNTPILPPRQPMPAPRRPPAQGGYGYGGY